MVLVDQSKFNQLLQATSQSQQESPYDLDLRTTSAGSSIANEFFFSILGCEEGTNANECGTLSGVLTTCGNCGV